MRRIAAGAAALATALIALGGGPPGWRLVVIVVGALWVGGLLATRGWAVVGGLIAMVAAAAVTVLLGASPILIAAGVGTALAAWQLHRLAIRLTQAEQIDVSARPALFRLLALIAAGTALAAVPSLLQLDLTFVAALLLAGLLVYLLSRIAIVTSGPEPPSR
ncbi:MAG: hypothetical protein ACFB51_18700 [Anaerolineae bacterium]